VADRQKKYKKLNQWQKGRGRKEIGWAARGLKLTGLGKTDH